MGIFVELGGEDTIDENYQKTDKLLLKTKQKNQFHYGIRYSPDKCPWNVSDTYFLCNLLLRA
jgi:hypothetical protein